MADWPAHGSLNYDTPLKEYIDEGDADNAAALADYAPLASPVFTGVPEGPTPALGTDTEQFATTEYVQNEIIAAGLEATFQNKVKTASQSVTNSAVLVNDSELFFTPVANAVYMVSMGIFARQLVDPDGAYKMALAIPSGNYSGGMVGPDLTPADTTHFARDAATNVIAHIGQFTADDEFYFYTFRVAIGATAASNVIFRWAQNSATPQTLTILPRSWMEVRRVA